MRRLFFTRSYHNHRSFNIFRHAKVFILPGKNPHPGISIIMMIQNDLLEVSRADTLSLKMAAIFGRYFNNVEDKIHLWTVCRVRCTRIGSEGYSFVNRVKVISKHVCSHLGINLGRCSRTFSIGGEQDLKVIRRSRRQRFPPRTLSIHTALPCRLQINSRHRRSSQSLVYSARTRRRVYI